MAWVLIIAGSLVGLLVLAVAVAAVLGALSPEAHTATRQVRLDRTPEEVWQVLTDIPAYPSWRSGLKRVEMLESEDGMVTWREHSREGKLRMQLAELDPPRRLVAKVADPSLPYSGAWTCELTPDGDSCVVRLTEDGEVYNVLYRFAARYVFRHTSGLDEYLISLGTHYGEAVKPFTPPATTVDH